MAELQHFLTYQHSVQSFFRDHQDKYGGVVIPLPIISTFPTGTLGFIRALCAGGKKFYGIDPRTALFQRNWNRKNVRPPHRKMADVLGEPFEQGLSGPMSASLFADESVVARATDRCLAYQKGFRSRSEDQRKLEKYRKLLALDVLEALQEPQFLIPPYFQFVDGQDAWWQVSLRCMQHAVRGNHGIPIRPVVHFREWSSPNWSRIIEQISLSAVTSVWLYPNDFREHEAELTELQAYRRVVSIFSTNGVEPSSLFGGFFAICLVHSGLRAFANGIGYGEWRDSGYHKGGTAENRIYIAKLHRYLDPAAAQALVDADPDYFARDSELLGACVDEQRSLLTLTRAECLDHFMACREAEIRLVLHRGIGSVVDEFSETINHLRDIGELERQKYGESLERWSMVLSA